MDKPAQGAAEPEPDRERRYIRTYFAQDARTYDRREWFRRRQRRRMVELSGAGPGQRVLDVCTGTGELALALAATGAEVVGVDLSLDMLALAQRKTATGSVRFQEADATHLPFPDRSFAVTTMAMALHCMPGELRRLALAEIARVTRDRVVLLEPSTPSSHLGRWLMVAVGRLMASPRYWPDFVRSNLSDLVQESGLTPHHEESLTFGFHRILVCHPELHGKMV